jgi:hypothetical protein
MPKTLPIEGAISYAGVKFLCYYLSLLSNDVDIFYYAYERTFDLQCAINIMMYMTNDKIKERMNLIKTVVSAERKVLQLQQLWIDVKYRNTSYSKILKLIEPLKEPPKFDVIKSEIENCLVFEK